MFYSSPVARQNEVCHQAVDKFISISTFKQMHMTLCMYMYVNYTKTQYFKTENNKLSNDKKNTDNHSWHNCLSEKFESTLSWLLYDMILRYWWIYYIKGWLL